MNMSFVSTDVCFPPQCCCHHKYKVQMPRLSPVCTPEVRWSRIHEKNTFSCDVLVLFWHIWWSAEHSYDAQQVSWNSFNILHLLCQSCPLYLEREKKRFSISQEELNIKHPMHLTCLKRCIWNNMSSSSSAKKCPLCFCEFLNIIDYRFRSIDFIAFIEIHICSTSR